MNTLYQAQQAVHRASAKYHGALAVYFGAQHPDQKGQGVHEAAEESRRTSRIYESALIDLLDCMLTSAKLEVTEEDIQRVRRMLELLEIEFAAIRG